MSDTKLADLTALTVPSGDDLLYVVDDPAGTPSDKKLALDNLFTRGTVTTSSPVIDAAQTWNAGGVTFTGLKLNITNTASAVTSKIMSTQLGGVEYFNVDVLGRTLVRGDNFGLFSPTLGVCNLGTFSSTAIQIMGPNLGPTLPAGSYLAWAAGAIGGYNSAATTGDTFLTRRAAANLRLGAADAAAPVAQTLSVQSGTAGASALTVSISGTALTIAGAITGTIAIGHAVTGTGVSAGTLITAGSGSSWTVNNSQTVGPITAYFNSVGQNLTITGSQGSGPSAGGSIIFQVAPAGAAATTAQNALQNALRIQATTAFGAFARIYLSGNDFYLADSGDALYMRRENSSTFGAVIGAVTGGNALGLGAATGIFFSSTDTPATSSPFDLRLVRDAANTLAQRNGAAAQESRIYGSYTSDTNFQRMSIKTLRESSGALSGATYVTTIAIPAYANLIGVTTRVTTAVTGATTYDVGDGSDVDLWGAAIGIALGSQSRTADFTAVAAVGAAATSRTVTLTANGSNFTGGVIEICLHYLTTEAD
jgi:hypothetical protein